MDIPGGGNSLVLVSRLARKRGGSDFDKSIVGWKWSEVLTESSEGKYDCQVCRAVAEEEEKDVVSDPRATHYLECIKDNERRSIYAECPTVGVVFRF